MITLFEQNIRTHDRQSSKGNQLKWYNAGVWYKADYTGYEGLAEYVVSGLLEYSNLGKEEYVSYETEKIGYQHNEYLGCSSKDFLEGDWQIITLERLFHNHFNESLNKSLYTIENHEKRIRFLVEQTERITGLKDFGAYMSKLLTLDAFFLNEDRHTHNIAVLMDGRGNYDYCPIFDNGAALLSDTTMDYPLHRELQECMEAVAAKTFCRDFEEQLDLVEKIYGQHIQFDFGENHVVELLKQEKYYPDEEKERVREIILSQRRKYKYLF